MTITDEEIASRLDLDHIRAAATFAANRITNDGAVYVTLTPGDSTAYHFLIAGPTADGMIHRFGQGGFQQPHEYVVVLLNDFGAAYPWDGRAGVHPSYAAEKWTRGRGDRHSDPWTGAVVATFLEMLALEIDRG